MELNQQRALDENLDTLINELNPMDVMKRLIDERIMTNNERRKLVETGHDQRVSVFLSILKKKGSESFSVFIEALAAYGCYRDLAEKLQRDEKLQKEKTTACEQRKYTIFFVFLPTLDIALHTISCNSKYLGTVRLP